MSERILSANILSVVLSQRENAKIPFQSGHSPHLVILLHEPPQNILQRRIILPKESLVNHAALLFCRLCLRHHHGFLGTVLAFPFERHAKKNGPIQGGIGFDAPGGEDGSIDFGLEGAGR